MTHLSCHPWDNFSHLDKIYQWEKTFITPLYSNRFKDYDIFLEKSAFYIWWNFIKDLFIFKAFVTSIDRKLILFLTIAWVNSKKYHWCNTIFDQLSTDFLISHSPFTESPKVLNLIIAVFAQIRPQGSFSVIKWYWLRMIYHRRSMWFKTQKSSKSNRTKIQRGSNIGK